MFKDSLEENSEVKKCQFNLAKVLDQLLQLRQSLIQKNSVITQESSEETPAKKRKLHDYEKSLETNFSSLKSWRDSTIENWNDRTRYVRKKIPVNPLNNIFLFFKILVKFGMIYIFYSGFQTMRKAFRVLIHQSLDKLNIL